MLRRTKEDESDSRLSMRRWLLSTTKRCPDQALIGIARTGLIFKNITMDAQGMSPFITVLGKMAPALSESQADSIWLQNTRDIQTATAGAYGVISISDFSRKEQLLEAGRLWQRLHLAATLSGMAMQPLNQIVERADREIQLTLSPQFGNVLQEFAGAKPRRGVFIFRIGYPVQMPLPSPRRSAEQVLI